MATDITKGAKEYVWITVNDSHDPQAVVTLESYTFDVVDMDGTVVQASQDCAILGNETKLIRLGSLVDATDLINGQIYSVRITFSDGTEEPKRTVQVRIREVVLE